MLNQVSKVILGKVWLSRNYKDSHNVYVFSQGPLKLTCTKKRNFKTITIVSDITMKREDSEESLVERLTNGKKDHDIN